MTQPARIAPSLLAADFAHLGDEVARIGPYVDLLHCDVMDGHFVPNIGIGIPVIASLRKVTDLTLDCHLMATNAEAYFVPLQEAGADMVTVHMEVYPDPIGVAAKARDLGLRFGLVINPPTPLDAVEPYLDVADMLVVMSVDPGFGGQEFIYQVLGKIERARKSIDSRGLATDIQVDGGIGPDNVRRARDAGADVFVAGNSIFRAPDPVAAVAELRARLSGQEQDAGASTRR